MSRPARVGHDRVRIRLVAAPGSVPVARQFARDAVTQWQLSELVDDAALCVSELASNAALHSGGDFLEVGLAQGAGSVRIVVDDDGPDPVADLAGVARDTAVNLAATAAPEALPSTGRGLFLVSAVASQWGIEQRPTGKRVWVRLEQPGDYHPVQPESAHSPLTSSNAALPSGWHLVRLVGCPVDLSLAHSRRLDDLARELQLLAHGSIGRSQALAEVIDELGHSQVHARQLGRRILQDAAEEGMARVDVEVPLAPGAAQRLRRLNQTLTRTDSFCEQEQLLTLPSTTDMVRLREWTEQELVRQMEHDRRPLSYDDWLSGQAGHA